MTALKVVVTAGAATPLLIRIRPIVKKDMDNDTEKLGKEVKRPTLAEVRTSIVKERTPLLKRSEEEKEM